MFELFLARLDDPVGKRQRERDDADKQAPHDRNRCIDPVLGQAHRSADDWKDLEEIISREEEQHPEEGEHPFSLLYECDDDNLREHRRQSDQHADGRPDQSVARVEGGREIVHVNVEVVADLDHAQQCDQQHVQDHDYDVKYFRHGLGLRLIYLYYIRRSGGSAGHKKDRGSLHGLS